MNKSQAIRLLKSMEEAVQETVDDFEQAEEEYLIEAFLDSWKLVKRPIMETYEITETELV